MTKQLQAAIAAILVISSISLPAQTSTAKKPTTTRRPATKKAPVETPIERQIRDPLYGKTSKRTSKFLAHNEANEAKVGDTVAIAESRPLSRRKRWIVTRVVAKAHI